MIPQIQIHQVFGQIGLNPQPARLSIHSQAADLEIHHTDPTLQVQRTPGDLQIDQTQAFADEGLKRPLALSQEEGQQAEAANANAILDTVHFGDQLLKSHSPQKDLAAHDLQPVQRQVETQIAMIPRPFSVHVHYTMGHISTELHNGRVTVDARTHQTDISATYGSVRVYLERTSSLTIDAPLPGSTIDAKV